MRSKASIRRAMRENPTLFTLPANQQAPEYMTWPIVTLTTDGACDPNPGLGTWACVLRMGQHCRELSGVCRDYPTTNNRAEMEAVIFGLRAITRPCRVNIRTDSMINVGIINGTGKKMSKRANQDLVQAMLEAMYPHAVKAEWVRGHAGDPDNERCDQMCVDCLG